MYIYAYRKSETDKINFRFRLGGLYIKGVLAVDGSRGEVGAEKKSIFQEFVIEIDDVKCAVENGNMVAWSFHIYIHTHNKFIYLYSTYTWLGLCVYVPV